MPLLWLVLHVLGNSPPVSLGPGRAIRNMLGWSQLEKTAGVWSMVVPWCPSKRGEYFSSLCAVGDWKKKGSYLIAWSVPCDSSCTCSFSYGQGPAIRPHAVLAGVWRAIAPLMKPWCAEGEVPTAANLNLYRGCDEHLFGEYGDAKLIVSVSFGSSAVFKWNGQSCPDDEGHLCWPGHGDILVTDGRCRTSFFIVRILVGNKNG